MNDVPKKKVLKRITVEALEAQIYTETGIRVMIRAPKGMLVSGHYTHKAMLDPEYWTVRLLLERIWKITGVEGPDVEVFMGNGKVVTQESELLLSKIRTSYVKKRGTIG